MSFKLSFHAFLVPSKVTELRAKSKYDELFV